jgi:hypothetical protein
VRCGRILDRFKNLGVAGRLATRWGRENRVKDVSQVLVLPQLLFSELRKTRVTLQVPSAGSTKSSHLQVR